MKRPIKVLKINEAKVHRLNEAFICKIDGETFPNKNDLVQHRVEVHGMGKAPMQPESVVRQGDFLITSPSYYQNRITSIKSQLKSNPNDEQLKAKLRLAQAALRKLTGKAPMQPEANNPVEEDIVDMTGDVDSQIATARERLKIWRAKTQDDRKNRMINYYMKRLRELEAKKNTKKEAKLPPHVRLSEFRKMVREEAHKILEKAGKKPRYVWKTESGKWAGRDEILGNTRYFDEARKARSYSQNGKIMRERKKK